MLDVMMSTLCVCEQIERDEALTATGGRTSVSWHPVVL